MEAANKKWALNDTLDLADDGSPRKHSTGASFGKARNEELLDKAAYFFYGCGLSHSIAKSHCFKAYMSAISSATPGH